MTKAEEDFLAERTRYLLAHVWCTAQLETGNMPTAHKPHDKGQIYVEYAQKRGWLSKREPLRVLSPGFKTAAAFLRR
jgi:hypothetical protein